MREEVICGMFVMLFVILAAATVENFPVYVPLTMTAASGLYALIGKGLME